MMLKKRKTPIVLNLAIRNIKRQKARNVLIVLGVVLSTLAIITFSSVGISYVHALEKQNNSLEGIENDALLTAPRDDQIEILKSNEKIKNIGVQISCATVIESGNDDSTKYILKWRDKIAWEEQTLPILNSLYGEYPKNEDEILMSKVALKESRIDTYKIGMDIPITYVDTTGVHQKVFTLSGYYDDGSNLLDANSITSFVSHSFMEKTGHTLDNEDSGKAYINFKSPFVSKKDIKKLESSLNIDYQVFFHNEFPINEAISTIVGCVLLSGLMVLCAYLLIYNVLYISLTNEIKDFGVLKAIGMSNSQINRMTKYQIIILLLIGLPIGCLIAAFICYFSVPKILSVIATGLIVNNQIYFNPFIYLIAIVLTIGSSLLANYRATKILKEISIIDASKFNGIKKITRWKTARKGGKLFIMAWRNVMRERTRSVVVVISLFIGLSSLICINILIESRNANDFVEYYVTSDIDVENQTIISEEPEQVFDQDFFSQLKKLDGIEDFQKISTNYVIYTYDNFMNEYTRDFFDKQMYLTFEEGMQEIEKNPDFYSGCIVGIGEKDFEKINNSLENTINKEDFDLGNVAILCNGFSMESANSFLGKTMAFGNGSGEKSSIQIGAVTDTGLSSVGGIAPTIYISENALEKFDITPIYERIEINTKSDFDAKTSLLVKRAVKDNQGISFSSKVDIVNHMESNNRQLSLIGNVLVVMTIFVGILNLINVLASSLVKRKKELSILSKIGMTRKQTLKMLSFEGGYYGLLAIGLSYTIGLGVSYGVFNLLKDGEYMKFTLQVDYSFIVILITLILTALLPTLIYSTIELKNN